MAEELEDAPWATPAAPPPTALPDAPWVAKPTAEAKSDLPDAPWAEKPPEDHMPGTLGALGEGIKAGLSDVSQSKQAIMGEKVTPTGEESPAAKPYEWSDLTSPISRGLPKVAYQIGKSAPTIGAGIVGGAAGSPAGPAGTVVGGATGAAAGAALQAIGPSFSAELRKSPNDPEGAWDRALKQAEISGLFSGAGWAAFPLKFFQGPLKNLAFQAFGVQPGIAMGEQATQNIAVGKDATENLGQAYVQGAVGTAVPALGQHAVNRLISPVPPSTSMQGPQQPGGFTQAVSKIPFVGDKITAALDGWKKSFQPELMSDLALQSQGFLREYNALRSQGHDALLKSEDAMHNFFERMTPQENIDFMKMAAGETARPALTSVRSQIPPDLLPAYDRFRRLLDEEHQANKNVGAQMGFIQDYFPRLYKDPENVARWANDRVQSLGPKNFAKKRTFDWMQDALDAGFELKYPNAADAVTSRLLSGVDMREKAKLLQQMNKLGVAAEVKDPAAADMYNKAGWQLVKDPIGKEWALHPDVQPMWKNVVDAKGLWGAEGPVGSGFRKWMALKNAWVPIKLGLSLFHPLHVAHINLVDGMTRGWGQLKSGDIGGAIKSAAKGIYGQAYFPEAIKAREAWLTPEGRQTPEQKALVKVMTEGGFSPQLAEQLRMKGHRAFQDAIAHQNWVKAVPLALVEGLRKSQSVIFEKWIPSLKTAAYLDQAKEVLRRNPQLLTDEVGRRAALGEIAKSVDNRFGEMYYSNLFWNKTIKDAGIGSFLSLGWNLGFVREFGGGLLEPVIKPLVDQTPTRQAMNLGKNKTAFALLYFTNAMLLNALMTNGMSGENPEGMDYFLPRIGGNNPDGSPRRLSNMFYTREVPMAIKHTQDKDSVIGGLREMVWNKSMFEPIKEIMQNKDYYGFNIMDENSPGYQQAWQMTKFILSDQFSPITISGAKRGLQNAGKWNEDDSVGQKLKKILTEPEGQLAMMGFGPAPAYASKSAAQNRLNHLFGQYVAPAERPQADKETMEKRRDARAQYMLAQQTKDPEMISSAARHLAELGVKSDQIRKIQPGNSDLYLYQRLPQKVQATFLKDLSAEEFKRYYPKSNKMTKADPDVIKLWRKYYQ